MPRSRGKLWLGFSALLAIGAIGAWFAPSAALDWQPLLAARQPWRWWTAAFVHWAVPHLAANLAGLAVIAALGRVAQVRGVLALAWAASWPLTHLSLLLQPELLHYGGLSGLLHAGVAVAAVFVVRRGAGRTGWIGWAVLAGLLLKILLEEPWGPALRPAAGGDFSVAPLAHATGAFWGTVCAGIALARDAPSEPPVGTVDAEAAHDAQTLADD